MLHFPPASGTYAREKKCSARCNECDGGVSASTSARVRGDPVQVCGLYLAYACRYVVLLCWGHGAHTQVQYQCIYIYYIYIMMYRCTALNIQEHKRYIVHLLRIVICTRYVCHSLSLSPHVCGVYTCTETYTMYIVHTHVHMYYVHSTMYTVLDYMYILYIQVHSFTYIYLYIYIVHCDTYTHMYIIPVHSTRYIVGLVYI